KGFLSENAGILLLYTSPHLPRRVTIGKATIAGLLVNGALIVFVLGGLHWYRSGGKATIAQVAGIAPGNESAPTAAGADDRATARSIAKGCGTDASQQTCMEKAVVDLVPPSGPERAIAVL